MADVETDTQERHLSLDDDTTRPDGTDAAETEPAGTADDDDTWVDPQTGEKFNKLSPFEAKVVALTLGDAVKQLRLLQQLKVDPEDQAEEYSKAQGETISAIMNRQAELEERFEALLLEREEITRADLPMAHAMAVNKEESLKVAEAMRNTTEELCANLQDTPDVDANLTHAQRVRMEAMTLLSDIINDVERDGTWPALNAYNKKIAEEKAAEDAIEAEAAEVEAENARIEQAFKDKTAEIEAFNKGNGGKLEALTKEISAKEREHAIELRYLQADLKGKGDEEEKMTQARITDLERQVAEMEALIEQEQSTHKAACEFLENRIATLNAQGEETQERNKTLKEEYERKLIAATQAREAAEKELEEEEALYLKEKALYDEWRIKNPPLTEAERAKKDYCFKRAQGWWKFAFDKIMGEKRAAKEAERAAAAAAAAAAEAEPAPDPKKKGK